MDTSKKINVFSYIRAISCIAIICLHTIFTAVGIYGQTVQENRLISYRVVMDNLMWAVPCFIMVTGALLLNKEKNISYKKIFTKYIGRILGAIFVFGLTFAFIDIVYSVEPMTMGMILGQLAEIITGNSWSHVWYLYCIIGLYLLLPFYKKIVNNSTKKEMIYLLAVYVVFLSIVPQLRNWNVNIGFYIHVSTIYPFYFFVGNYLWEYQSSIKIREKMLIFVSTIFIIFLSWIGWSRGIDKMRSFFVYSSMLIIVQSIGVFSLLSKINIKIDCLKTFLLKIDENSFGIYLIHMIYVRYVFKQMGINPFEKGGWLCVIGLIFVITILSWISVSLLKKIAIVNKIL